MKELKYMSDEEIEHKVREDSKDARDGVYSIGDFKTGKEGAILYQIELMKGFRDEINRV